MEKIYEGLPFSKEVFAGTLEHGFGGEIKQSDFITYEEFIKQTGLTITSPINKDEPWLKFFYKGNIIFCSKKLIGTITYEQVYSKLKNRDLKINIEGKEATVGCMRTSIEESINYSENNNKNSNYADDMVINSEYYDLLISIIDKSTITTSQWRNPSEDYSKGINRFELNYNISNLDLNKLQVSETLWNNQTYKVYYGTNSVYHNGGTSVYNALGYRAFIIIPQTELKERYLIKKNNEYIHEENNQLSIGIKKSNYKEQDLNKPITRIDYSKEINMIGDKYIISLYNLPKKIIMTDNDKPYPLIAKVSSEWSSATKAYLAFDGVNIGNLDRWSCSNSDKSPYLQLDFGKLTLVNKIIIHNSKSTSVTGINSIKDFDIQISLDGIEFNTIKSIRNEPIWKSGEIREFKITTQLIRVFRIQIYNNHGYQNTSIGLIEFE